MAVLPDSREPPGDTVRQFAAKEKANRINNSPVRFVTVRTNYNRASSKAVSPLMVWWFVWRQ